MDQRGRPEAAGPAIRGRVYAATEVQVVNMSISGMALRLPRRLEVGSEHGISLLWGRKVLLLKAETVWCVESGRGEDGAGPLFYTAGVRFSDVLSQRLMDLLDFVEQHKVGPDSERRAGGLRFEIDAPGSALVELPQDFEVCSIAGDDAEVLTDHPLHAGRLCRIELRLDGHDVRASARIQSCAPDEPPRYRVAFSLEEMGRRERRRLQQHARSSARRQERP